MTNNRSIYWVAQLAGWLVYAGALVLNNAGLEGAMYLVALQAIGIILFVGIGLTHFYRFVIIKLNWLRLAMFKAFITVLFSSVILGALMHLLHIALSDVLIPNLTSFLERDLFENLQMVISYSFLMLFWSILYFSSHYFVNYKREEIKNLKMEASQNEIELNNLKSQLNPHFMFNALNSIRALVDEDPIQAKNAVTQLSAMLRGALQTGKRNLITLDEELNLVKNYLAIEKIRFEERLKVEFNIQHNTLHYNIPPLLLQTVVENGVKHGISSLPKGGQLFISTYLDGEKLMLEVKNSGQYNPEKIKKNSTRIGLKNSEKRLNLLYGKDAVIHIENENNLVKTEITIPKNLIYENTDS